MQDDFKALTDYHLLPITWLGSDPAQAIRASVEQTLQEQNSSSRIAWFRVVDTPRILLSGVELPGEQLQVKRAAIVIAFRLQVRAAEGAERLDGAFTWVVRNLDRARDDQVYLDLEPGFWSSSDFKLVLLERTYNSPGDAPWHAQPGGSNLVGGSELTDPAQGWPFIIKNDGRGKKPEALPSPDASRPNPLRSKWNWKFWQR